MAGAPARRNKRARTAPNMAGAPAQRNKRARTARGKPRRRKVTWQPSKEGTLSQLPDELLLNVMSFLDHDTLLLVANLGRSLGRTAQEQLFHAIALDTRHLNGIFHRARQLTRTLLDRPDLRSKVKSLSMYIAQTGRSTTNDPDPLNHAQKATMVNMMVNAHWGMIGGRTGPVAEAYRSRCGGTLGAMLMLFPTLQSFEIKTQSVKTSIALYTMIFGVLRAPLHRIPAFSKLRNLSLEQPIGCPPLPWLYFGAPDSLLELGNLTRLEISILSTQNLVLLAASAPTRVLGIKYLSIQLDLSSAAWPIVTVGLANFLRCTGPLTSFTFTDATEWSEPDGSTRVNLIYCVLLSYLTASHESLEKCTIVCSSCPSKSPRAYPMTNLQAFKRLRVLDIEQTALVGRPIDKMDKTWDHTAGREVALAGTGLLERLPLSLDTLVVNGADMDLIRLCDDMLLQKCMAAKVCDGAKHVVGGGAHTQAEQTKGGVELHGNENLGDERAECCINTEWDGEPSVGGESEQVKEEKVCTDNFPLASLQTVNVKLGKTRQVVPATLLARWDQVGWKLDGQVEMEDRTI